MTPGGMSWLRKDSIPLRELHTGLGFCFTLDRIFVRLVCLWVGTEDREHESCDCCHSYSMLVELQSNNIDHNSTVCYRI